MVFLDPPSNYGQQTQTDMDRMVQQRLASVEFLLQMACAYDGATGRRRLITLADHSGILPLHLACCINSPDIVRLLLCNLGDDDKAVPTSRVSSDGRASSGGEGLPAVSPDGSSASVPQVKRNLSHASWFRASHLLKEPTKHAPPEHITWSSAGMTSVLFAARAGALKVLKMLCEELGLSDSVCDHSNRSALHHACASAHHKVPEHCQRAQHAAPIGNSSNRRPRLHAHVFTLCGQRRPDCGLRACDN